MKTESWSCDWCGAELTGQPALRSCVQEVSTGTVYFAHDGCQTCLDKFIAMLDPDKSQRAAMSEKMGRSIRFLAFPGKMLCGCKSAITCPHGV